MLFNCAVWVSAWTLESELHSLAFRLLDVLSRRDAVQPARAPAARTPSLAVSANVSRVLQ
jgi:hypothetical protein